MTEVYFLPEGGYIFIEPGETDPEKLNIKKEIQLKHDEQIDSQIKTLIEKNQRIENKLRKLTKKKDDSEIQIKKLRDSKIFK
jgi:hypothetical protein